MTIPADKRAFDRIQRKFVLRVSADDSPWPLWSMVTTHNLSAGGAQFTIDQKLKVGQPLLIKLHFVDREIDCKGKVSRIADGFQNPLMNLAVTFEWGSEIDREYVEQFVKHYKEQT